MKTYNIDNYILNEEQYKTLSWLATSLISLNNFKYKIEGIMSVCSILEISDILISNVYYNQYRKGLRNFNKLTTIETF